MLRIAGLLLAMWLTTGAALLPTPRTPMLIRPPVYKYSFKFLTLSQGLNGLAQLRAFGVYQTNPVVMNGDPRDSLGNVTSNGNAVFFGKQGLGLYWYVDIRSPVNPATINFNAASYGMTVAPTSELVSLFGVLK